MNAVGRRSANRLLKLVQIVTSISEVEASLKQMHAPEHNWPLPLRYVICCSVLSLGYCVCVNAESAHRTD